MCHYSFQSFFRVSSLPVGGWELDNIVIQQTASKYPTKSIPYCRFIQGKWKIKDTAYVVIKPGCTVNDLTEAAAQYLFGNKHTLQESLVLVNGLFHHLVDAEATRGRS